MIPLYLTLFLFLPPLLEETFLILLTPLLTFLILTPNQSLEKLNHYQLTSYSSATLLLIKTVTNWFLKIIPHSLFPLLIFIYFKEINLSTKTLLELTFITTFFATTTPYLLRKKEVSHLILFSLPQIITLLYQNPTHILSTLIILNLILQYYLIQKKEKNQI